MDKFLIKRILFLSLFISSISHANSFILWSQQSWFERVWEFFIKLNLVDSKIEEKVKKKQEAMINQLHNEYENALHQLAKDIGVSDYDWQEFLKKRAQEKEEFLKSLETPRKNCYHDPQLSRDDKELFADACKIYNFNTEAIDIKFGNLDKTINAEVKIINYVPTVIVDKRYWNFASKAQKARIFLHELGHLIESHYVTLRQKNMTILFPEKIIVPYMQHKEAIAEIIGDCKSKSYNELRINVELETLKGLSKNNLWFFLKLNKL